jgi:hypothetical protein
MLGLNHSLICPVLFRICDPVALSENGLVRQDPIGIGDRPYSFESKRSKFIEILIPGIFRMRDWQRHLKERYGDLATPWSIQDDEQFAASSANGYLLIPPHVRVLNPLLLTIPGRPDACAQITSVTSEADSQLRRVEALSFSGFTALQSVSLPASLEYLGPRCFAQLRKLLLVIFQGSRLRRIEDEAFFECSAVMSICIPASVEYIGHGAFAHSGLHSVTFESGSALQRIEDEAFFKCQGLDSICIPAQVVYVGHRAFAHSDLVSVAYEAGAVVQPEDDAFEGCRWLA